MQLGILGAGTMGEIIARALLEREVYRPEEIVLAEQDADRRRALSELGVTIRAETEALTSCDVVLLCVKPQNARAAVAPLAGRLGKQTLVISIMAGIELADLAVYLDHPMVVRAMPNLPARIGQGITVWQPAEAVPDRLRMVARMVFLSLGREVEVAREDLIDAATAVSGTGPAYIFYIAENLLQAALGFGFEEDQAHKLVQETFRGAMDLWASTGEPPDALRRKVTSKGGTTHAAVTYFQQHDVAGIFRAGVERAAARARELAQVAKGATEA
jgi:pyrroline-5-carboxylate reductase